MDAVLNWITLFFYKLLFKALDLVSLLPEQYQYIVIPLVVIAFVCLLMSLIKKFVKIFIIFALVAGIFLMSQMAPGFISEFLTMGKNAIWNV